MKFKIMMVYATSVISLMGMENSDQKRVDHGQLKSITVGALSGMAEVLIDQPLITIKNFLQERRKNPDAKMPRTFKDFYRGFNANILGMVPTTAMQMLVYDKVKSLCENEENSPYKSWAPVAASGFAGAIAASPIELVIIRQHKDQITLRLALNRIRQEHGMTKLLGRGLVATTWRDIGFTKGILEGQPWAKQQLITFFPSIPSGAASLISGAGVGVTVAVVTHPFDTIKYRQQSFAANTMYDACRLIYKEGGVIAFWDGVSARGARVILATIVISETRKKMQRYL